MREMTVRITRSTKEEQNKNKSENNEALYKVTIVGKEKMCERCPDRVECLMGTEKCQAYHADGVKAYADNSHKLKDVIKWVKDICGEL